MHYLELICWPTIKLLDAILPLKRFPELAFLICLLVFFVSVDFILTVVSVLSIYTHLSHVLLALTLISWGSSPIELINLAIANTKGELQMGLTSVLSGIVLAFYIILPAAIIYKLNRRQSHEIQILQPVHSSHLMFFPALLLTLVTFLVFHHSGMKFTNFHSWTLIASYLIYVGYMST